MQLLSKSKSADYLGITRQHIRYHTLKKGGVFPCFVHEENGETKLDVTDPMLLAIAEKIKNIASKKGVRGQSPEYVGKKKGTKKAKKVVKKKVAKEKVAKKSPKDETETLTDKNIPMTDLFANSERAKCEQEIYKAAKLKNDLGVSRGSLVSRELVADVMVAYLDSLSKEILQMPVSVIQEIVAGIEAGKSNIELVNDLRKHLSIAIANTKKASVNTMRRLLR